ncbi:J domain-containing protein [Sulfidibacter corallicola]|uniref:J domain-containing protein n=1 Tax=Sulfidibacter corallicola TaxID=2818388 RepID=A0A8A4TUZ6_SULCO|nr:DnaJ domain-containing protein [Sulfidibacter corallicola]QTD52842.1 hypothetical protein J3U87_10225 [Sulfidibacter corallicola]
MTDESRNLRDPATLPFVEDPFALLGVSADADDAAIREAFLSRVRHVTPDRDPEGYQRLRRAYEQIADAEARVRYVLFRRQRPDVDLFLEALFREVKPGRLSRASFHDLLNQGLMEASAQSEKQR